MNEVDKSTAKLPYMGFIEELKILVETLYAIQKYRIQAELRIQSFVRDGRLTKIKAGQLHHMIDERLKSEETIFLRDVSKMLKSVPIWTDFMKKIKGIGPAIAGSLIAGIVDIAKFDAVASLWKYCAQDVINTPLDTADEEEPIIFGEAPRRESGEKITWNPFMRATIFKMTDSFVKQNPEKSLYRRLYDKKKKYYQERFPEYSRCHICGSALLPQKVGPDKCSNFGDKDTKPCSGQTGGIPHPFRKITRGPKKGQPYYIHTKIHIHNMAKRYAGKIFMQHLWVVWRQMEGLEISKPWIFSQEGHTHYIRPEHSEAFDPVN
jgi:hypothetical protein